MSVKHMKKLFLVIILLLLTACIGMGFLYWTGQKQRVYRGIFIKTQPAIEYAVLRFGEKASRDTSA